MANRQQIEEIRKIANPDVVEFLRRLDTATTRKEVYRINHDMYDIIPGLRDMKVGKKEDVLAYLLSDMCNKRESEINKAERDAKKAEREQKETEKKEKKASTDIRIKKILAQPELKKALEPICSRFYDQIVKQVTERYEAMVKRYFTDGKFNLPRPNARTATRGEYMAYQNTVAELSPLMDMSNLRTNWKSIVKAAAEYSANFNVECFRVKLATKLGNVIEEKGGATVKGGGNTVIYELFFDFKDKSSFKVKTQQVLSHSIHGKLFARYPTTFHNVVFKDGSKMVTPSSAKMQKEFGIDIVEKEN